MAWWERHGWKLWWARPHTRADESTPQNVRSSMVKSRLKERRIHTHYHFKPKKWQSETSWNIYKANDDSVTATCELLSNNWHEAFRLETNNVHQTRDFFQAIGVQKDPPPHKTPREISQETRITEDNLEVEENHQCIISNKRVSINLSSLNELKEMPFCQAYSVPEARPSKADKEPLLRLCDDSRRWWNLRPFSRGASGSTPMLPRWSQAMKLPNKPEAPPAMMNSCRLPWLATVTPNSKAI